ncbi:MAG TPA: hypothetical protein VGL22_07450 [Terracidiphilus sp.]|jgi:hypothetical protein
MNRSLLLIYQWATGLSDSLTGILLYVAPAFTLRMMGVHAPADAMPYIGYIGAFVLTTGLACLYGAYLLHVRACPERIETVWLLTAFSRAAVAIYIAQAITAGTLENAWISVALFDGACVLVQAIGLSRRWLKHA